MLYNSNENTDFLNILAACDGYMEGLSIEGSGIDESKIQSILRGMRHDFPAQGGSDAASPFKKAANFLCYFVASQPIKTPFPPHLFKDSIVEIHNHQNAMVGLHIAIDSLHNATIHRKDRKIVLANRIEMSRHSYIDTIQACSQIQPVSHFHIVSVFLEQMCYRFNPEACYELVKI